MATNWPPPEGTYPSWPPPEYPNGIEFCNWEMLHRHLIEYGGWTHDAPTLAERQAYFVNARCGDNHQVSGRMLVSPDGQRRYPFARCMSTDDRELLVLWPPYTCGWRSSPTSWI